jgi:integrase
MRQGELFALEWSDVNRQTRTIEVRQSLQDTADGLTTGPTKTGNRRSMKVSASTMAALEAHRKRQAKTALSKLVLP